MKKLIVSVLCLLSLNATAGNGVERMLTPVDFSNTSGMSYQAQERVVKILNAHCQPAAENAAAVSVRNLIILKHSVDQGITDLTYKFDVVLHSLESYNNEVVSIVLKEADMHNPRFDKFSLLSLEANEGVCQ